MCPLGSDPAGHRGTLRGTALRAVFQPEPPFFRYDVRAELRPDGAARQGGVRLDLGNGRASSGYQKAAPRNLFWDVSSGLSRRGPPAKARSIALDRHGSDPNAIEPIRIKPNRIKVGAIDRRSVLPRHRRGDRGVEAAFV